MAGPTAGVLLPEPMSDETKADVRAETRRMSTFVCDDFWIRDDPDFWVQERWFFVGLGPEDDGELDEYFFHGVPELIGWPPRDTLWFAAMANDRQDHRLLAELCLHFARKMNVRAHRDRVGLVRVSTVARVLSPLTEDLDEFRSALETLRVKNGWTALWDGLRVGHEVLELKRVAMAGIVLRDVAPGKWRYVTPEELSQLREPVSGSKDRDGSEQDR